MRIVGVVEHETHVCCRYRLAAFRLYFARSGHSLELRELPRGSFGRLRLFRDLRSADVVILQRKLLPAWQLAVLRRSAKNLVFDFDDAVWLRDSYSPRGVHSAKRLARFARTVAACDGVSAGNEYLAAAAREFAQPGAVRVIPTCVDVAAYPPAVASSGPGLRLVWVGSSSTLRGLEQFRDTLSAIGRAVPGTRLKIVCDRFPEIADLTVDAVPWADATEAAEIASCDAGIAYVPDDAWSRGKCGLKVLQYQAAGLPVVANEVGVHPEMVRPGETGFLADSTEEWVAAVRALAADAESRNALGRRGRERVAANYDVNVGGRLWADWLGTPGVRKSA